MSDSSAPTYDPMLDQPAAAAAAAPAAEAQHSEPMDPVGMAGSAVNTAAEVVGGISGTLVGGVQAAWGALNPLARRLNTGFHIAKQITTETIGVTRATEFSEQYRHLETNVRRLERAHSLLIRSVNQISGPTPLVPVKRVIGGISSLLDGSNAQATSAPAETSNAQHAKAVAAQFSHVAGVLLGTAPISQTQATLSLSPETPMPDSAIDKGARAMAQACQHLASIQESFGTAHAKLNAEIINQVVAPLQDSLELITSALNTCRTAVNARLELDAVKSRVNPNRASSEESMVDLEMAQIRFYETSTDAEARMEHCLRVCTATAVRCLVVLLNAIRAYHLQALSSIDALLPRIEEAATNAGITTSAASSSEPVPDNGLVTDIP